MEPGSFSSPSVAPLPHSSNSPPICPPENTIAKFPGHLVLTRTWTGEGEERGVMERSVGFLAVYWSGATTCIQGEQLSEGQQGIGLDKVWVKVLQNTAIARTVTETEKLPCWSRAWQWLQHSCCHTRTCAAWYNEIGQPRWLQFECSIFPTLFEERWTASDSHHWDQHLLHSRTRCRDESDDYCKVIC